MHHGSQIHRNAIAVLAHRTHAQTTNEIPLVLQFQCADLKTCTCDDGTVLQTHLHIRWGVTYFTGSDFKVFIRLAVAGTPSVCNNAALLIGTSFGASTCFS